MVIQKEKQLNTMDFNSEDIQSMTRFYRANLINSMTGYKPANLIGTISKEGKMNLAVFSSVVHLGSNPALVAFIQRPLLEGLGHTYENIIETEYYTINHIYQSMTEEAHYTSAKFPSDQSEFDACHIGAEFKENFSAPFVKESRVKFGLKFVEELPLRNGTRMIVGEVQNIFIEDELVKEDGTIDLEKAGSAAISGLGSYYLAAEIGTYPYASLKSLPEKYSLK